MNSYYIFGVWCFIFGTALLVTPWATVLEPVVEAIIARAMQTPYEHLTGYMNRYWLLSPRRRFPLAIRVQQILRSDLERHFHTHPGPCVSILLKNHYVEMMPRDQRQHPEQDATEFVAPLRSPGHVIFRSKDFRHRLLLATGGTCWTMFITWGWKEETGWGYADPDAPGAFVDRREYPAWIQAKREASALLTALDEDKNNSANLNAAVALQKFASALKEQA